MCRLLFVRGNINRSNSVYWSRNSVCYDACRERLCIHTEKTEYAMMHAGTQHTCREDGICHNVCKVLEEGLTRGKCVVNIRNYCFQEQKRSAHFAFKQLILENSVCVMKYGNIYPSIFSFYLLSDFPQIPLSNLVSYSSLLYSPLPTPPFLFDNH